jgi:D-lactate dehydrogenase (cytochrome)
MTQLPIKPTLFLELTGSSTTAVQEQVDLTKSICLEEFNGSNFVFKNEEAERKALWAARHELYYASLALRPGATSAILTDACVPLSKFASLITSTVEEIEKANVVGPCFGHAGDGNFHAIFPVLDTDSQEYLNKIHALNDELIARTIEAGGTCTGEHGVGYGKIKYLSQQYGEGGVEMMRRVKTGLDPFNIMNPGKVVIL